MPLTSGCSAEADLAFRKKYNCSLETDIKNSTVQITNEAGLSVVLSKVLGDCTAATIYTGLCNLDEFLKAIPMIREYLSLNARINCFGSRLIDGENKTKDLIKALVDHDVSVSHVTQGNRNQRANEYMVSYNICTTSPIVSGYRSGKITDVKNTTHNHFDKTKFKDLRKQFGLYPKQGKSL